MPARLRSDLDAARRWPHWYRAREAEARGVFFDRRFEHEDWQ